MKNKRIYSAIALIILCITFSGTICLASESDTVSPFAYRETLLISYKEYWYTDGSGTESHVKYNHQYRTYTFLNGYRQLSPKITQLPTTGDELPVKASIHQLVELSYEFY